MTSGQYENGHRALDEWQRDTRPKLRSSFFRRQRRDMLSQWNIIGSIVALTAFVVLLALGYPRPALLAVVYAINCVESALSFVGRPTATELTARGIALRTALIALMICSFVVLVPELRDDSLQAALVGGILSIVFAAAAGLLFAWRAAETPAVE